MRSAFILSLRQSLRSRSLCNARPILLMDLHTTLGIVSAVVFAIGYIPYIYSIARGATQPHPFSWLLWTILGFVSFYLYIHVGATTTLPLALFNCILPFAIVFLSLRMWRGGFSKFDYACLGISLLAILTYAFTHDATVALTVNLLADLTAFLPTIRKTYKDPSSEDLATWVLFTAGYALSIVAIGHWTYGIAVFPIYFTTLGTYMCGIMIRAKLRKSKKYSSIPTGERPPL